MKVLYVYPDKRSITVSDSQMKDKGDKIFVYDNSEYYTIENKLLGYGNGIWFYSYILDREFTGEKGDILS